MKALIIFCLATLTSACVYVPKRISIYDEECDITVKHMLLESKQIDSLRACQNDDCIFSVLEAGIFAASSVIVSGSIVVSANVAYWFEKQANCR